MNCAIKLRKYRCGGGLINGGTKWVWEKNKREIKLKANWCSLMTFVTDLPSTSYRVAANGDDDNGVSCLPLCKKRRQQKGEKRIH